MYPRKGVVKMNCQELSSRLHTLKISDNKLADHCNVTRVYMCNVRNGHKQGSLELQSKLQELYDYALDHNFFNQTEDIDTFIVDSEYTEDTSTELELYTGQEDNIDTEEIFSTHTPIKQETALDRYQKKYKGMSFLQILAAKDKELTERIYSKRKVQTVNPLPTYPIDGFKVDSEYRNF